MLRDSNTHIESTTFHLRWCNAIRNRPLFWGPLRVASHFCAFVCACMCYAKRTHEKKLTTHKRARTQTILQRGLGVTHHGVCLKSNLAGFALSSHYLSHVRLRFPFRSASTHTPTLNTQVATCPVGFLKGFRVQQRSVARVRSDSLKDSAFSSVPWHVSGRIP